MERANLTEPQIARVFADLRREVERRLQEKGTGSLVSCHEILGVISEEFHELEGAVESSNKGHVTDHLSSRIANSMAAEAKDNRVKDELYDIAVACIVGLTSYNVGGVEW